MQNSLNSILLALSFVYLYTLISCKPEEAQAVSQGKYAPARLSVLYSKAEEYIASWPDSLLIVAEQIKREGLRANNKQAIVRGERYLAQAKWRLGSHKEAMKLAIKALSDAEKWKTVSEIPDIYTIIGNLHKEKANYDMAFASADKGMRAAQMNQDTMAIIGLIRLKAMFTQGLGSQKKDTAMIHRSLDMHLEGLKIAESSPRFERQLTGYYNNIAQVYVKRDEPEKALFYVKKAIILANKYRQRLSLTYSYTWLSQVYFKNNDIENGTRYLQEALRICHELKNPFREMEISRYLYQALEPTGDYKHALEAYTRFIQIRDSLRVLENVRQIGELEIQYEAEKKDQQISALAAVNEVKSREIIWALVGVGVFVILSVFMLFQYRIITHSNRILEVNNQKINEQSEKLKVLMKELHHRVKNNLQTVSNLLSLQSSRLVDEDAKQSMKTGQQRIEAMSLVHKSLYSHDNVNMVDMNEYVTNLVESIMQSFGIYEDKLIPHINIEVKMLDIDIAMPIGLIVNEWITNSFKHAYKNVEDPKLSVILVEKDKLYLEIVDNGPGIDLQKWEKPGNSFGIKLVKVLARQLDANCRVTVDNGTRLLMQIPLPKHNAAT
ncbi:tetratricopeptide repeat-containing sensor histidine kinase [Dyadobacter arcticus]|uniref:histidine kinase n=1 Tax=Dyadobacter arcticus TaxID=1078754 RepID=A0ABX0UPY7_9BACT|nr:sensor histidine kinase [Dyadobacter arcticus]NIJ53730.1 two-component sensor histidine kinase [Dyadobacter arcticus]